MTASQSQPPCQSQQKRRRGLILDVDGTLVDSNDFHARAWEEALAGQGIGTRLDAVRRAIGMGGDKLLPAVASKAGVGVVALRCGGWQAPKLSGALAVYDDPADLLAHFDQSPLASGKRSLEAVYAA